MNLWDIVKFFLFLLLPWMLGKFFKFLASASKNQATSSETKFEVPSLWDRIRVTILLFAVVHYFWISLGRGAPKNFFQKINTDVDSPVFQIRTHFGDWVAKESGSSSAFRQASEALKDSCCASGSLEEFEAFRERLWSSKQSSIWSWLPFFSAEEDPLTSSEGLRFQQMQCLFERLKSPTRRTLYLQFGESAILNCPWCTDDTDYSLFVLAEAGASYCMFLVLVGLVSAKKERQSWRKLLVVIVLFMAIFESLYYLAPHEVASIDVYADLFSDAPNVGLNQKLTILRHLSFFIMLTVALLFENGISHTNAEQLNTILKNTEKIADFIKLERLEKSALVANKELRKHYISNFEKIENVTPAAIPDQSTSVSAPVPISRPANFELIKSLFPEKNAVEANDGDATKAPLHALDRQDSGNQAKLDNINSKKHAEPRRRASPK